MSSLTITILLCVALVGVLVLKRRNEKASGSGSGGEPAPGSLQRVSVRSRRKSDTAATRPRRARPRLALSVPGRLSGDEVTTSVPAVPVLPAVPPTPSPVTVDDLDDPVTVEGESPAPAMAPATEAQPAEVLVDVAPSNELIDAPGWPNPGELGAVLDYAAFDPHPDAPITDDAGDSEASSEEPAPDATATDFAAEDADFDPATGWGPEETDEWSPDADVAETDDTVLQSWSSESWSASESSDDPSPDVSPHVSIDDLFEGAAVWDDPDLASAEEFDMTPVLTTSIDADWETADERDDLSGDWPVVGSNTWTTNDDTIEQAAPEVTPVRTLDRETVDADDKTMVFAVRPMTVATHTDPAPAPVPAAADERAGIQASTPPVVDTAAANKARKKIKRLEKQLAETQAELARVTQLLAETTQNQLIETVRRLEHTIASGVITTPQPLTAPVVEVATVATPKTGPRKKTATSAAKAPAPVTRRRAPFTLSAKEARTLRAIAARRSQPQMRRRAQIILAAARGESTKTTAARLDVDISTVRRWRARFVAERLAMVADYQAGPKRR